MARPGSVPLKNLQHERYCHGVASGMTKKDAYAAAGYSGSPHGGTTMIDRRIGVADRVSELVRQISEKTVDGLANANVVNTGLLTGRYDEVYERAMEGTPLMAKDGTPTGVCKPDLGAANASIAGLMKLHGLGIEVTRNEDLSAQLEGKSNEDLVEMLKGLLSQVDPNMAKQVKADLATNEASEGDSNDETDTKPTEPTLQ